jgi:EAL domain-containing protein (putative c-di-GMP-specific phosphodiesterase class I)/GGDEF domain-containing protein
MKQIYGVVHDVGGDTEVKEIEREYPLKYYDTVDSAGLEEYLSEAIVHSNQTETPSAYLLIEISNFFEACHADGSESSFQLVQLVKDKLLSHLRQSDVIGYYGDGQFGVILRNITQKPLREIASRLINTISGLNISNTDLPLQVNILGTSIPKELTTVESLKMTTQHAMHRSRVLGVNQYFYSAEASVHCNEKSYILECVNEGRLELAFQPVIEANNRNCVNFYECLARIFDETDNLIPAFQFVSIIENMGLIHILDREVLKKAFAILSNNESLTLSINLTSDSVSDEEWMKSYKMLSQKNSDAATRLIVEVTERLAITDFEKTAEFLNTLRNHGTKVAIDDFGAGYTSFQYIRDLPIDILKIDGSYVKDISNNKNNQILIRTIVSLAKEFNIKVVAEFVETVEEAELLASYGIDYLQGYLFGKPQLGLPD